MVNDFKGGIDYIWYGTLKLAVAAVLEEVDAEYSVRVVGFPNAHFPSE